MSTYVNLDSNGYVQYHVVSSIDQPGMTQFDDWITYLATQPSPYHKFQYSTLTWVDDGSNNSVKAVDVRAQRDALLTASDWTQVTDSPLTTDVKAAWATYRAALRNLPQQSGFPLTITWPTAPGA
jgi:hypothetical protein